MLKNLARRVLPASVQPTLSRWLGRLQGTQPKVPTSWECEIVTGEVQAKLLKGWQEPTVAERQHAAFVPLLQQLYKGKPREDFVAVAKAVELTGLENPLIIEVGCGSGWNSEVLRHLLKRPIKYIGMDYSAAMAALGKRYYPEASFVVGNATALPFRDGAGDILLSGTVLMHLLGYQQAIEESRRVTRKWCIFHTVPVTQTRPTTVLRKSAYGSPVVEVILNKEEFLKLLESNGLALREVLDNIRHDYLSELLGESIVARTYVCEVV